MTDQRLEGLPVPAGVSAAGPDQTEQPRGRPGIEPGQYPPRPGVVEFDVVGVHQLGGRHVDQPMIEHIGAQQHLPGAAFKSAQVHLVLRQHDAVLGQFADLLRRHIDPPAAHSDRHAGDRRILVAGPQPDDDVFDTTDRLARLGDDRTAQQLRQMNHRPRPGRYRRARTACDRIGFTHHTPLLNVGFGSAAQCIRGPRRRVNMCTPT